jgi:hypothetical protein
MFALHFPSLLQAHASSPRHRSLSDISGATRNGECARIADISHGESGSVIGTITRRGQAKCRRSGGQNTVSLTPFPNAIVRIFQPV